MATRVLIDIFSLIEYKNLLDAEDILKVNLKDLVNSFHVIENLILCDQVVVDINGVGVRGLSHICEIHGDAIDYIDSSSQKRPLYLSNEYPSSPARNKKYRLDPCNLYVLERPCNLVSKELMDRTLGYIQLANHHNIYFSPHPVRNKFLVEFNHKQSIQAKKIIAYCDNIISKSDAGKYSNIELNVPAVVEHVIFLAKKEKITIPEAVYIVRNTNNAKKFREYCMNLEEELRGLTPRKNLQVNQKILRDLDKVALSWSKDINEHIKFKKRKIKLSKLPIIGGLEFFGVEDKEVKDPIIFRNKNSLLFINDLYR